MFGERGEGRMRSKTSSVRGDIFLYRRIEYIKKSKCVYTNVNCKSRIYISNPVNNIIEVPICPFVEIANKIKNLDLENKVKK